MKTYITTSDSKISFELSNDNGQQHELDVNYLSWKTELINIATLILKNTQRFNIEKLLKLENQNLNSNKDKDKVYNTLNISIPITEEIIKEVAYTKEDIIDNFLDRVNENLLLFTEDNHIDITIDKKVHIENLLNQIKETLI